MRMMQCPVKTEGCDLSCPHYLPHKERGPEDPRLRMGPGKCLYCVLVTDQPGEYHDKGDRIFEPLEVK